MMLVVMSTVTNMKTGMIQDAAATRSRGCVMVLMIMMALAAATSSPQATSEDN